MTKCVICDVRPSQNGHCAHCLSKIEQERKARRPEKPFRYLTYRDNVVGLFRNGKGTLTPRLLTRRPDTLPKPNTIDLNNWVEGFTRQEIKRFKACVLQCANA